MSHSSLHLYSFTVLKVILQIFSLSITCVSYSPVSPLLRNRTQKGHKKEGAAE